MACIKWVARFALWLALGLLLTLRGVAAQPVKVGAGTYHLSPKGSDKGMPPAPHRTDDMLKRAAPTSQWYSTLVFAAKPEALFVQPITVKTVAAGLEFALPSKEVAPTTCASPSPVAARLRRSSSAAATPVCACLRPANGCTRRPIRARSH